MSVFTPKLIAEMRKTLEPQHGTLDYVEGSNFLAALDEIERLNKAGDKLAEYVDLLARKGDDITTAELEGALNAFTQWHSLKGGEG